VGPAWLVDRFWQLRLAGNAAPVRALLAPDYRLYENDLLVVTGADAAVARLGAISLALPERSVRIHERVAAGRRVLERWTVEARTSARDGAGPRLVRIHGASWTLCRDDRIAELRQWWDVTAVLRQIADAPPLAPPIPVAFARLGAR
jgi:limonene-1,2-epoxide hydrolase